MRHKRTVPRMAASVDRSHLPALLVDHIDAVLDAARRARQVFCFLDYDGTLAPIAPRPDQALPLPGTEAVLSDLAAAPGMMVAIVTGRPIADVCRFIDLPALYYIGIHGLEIRLPFAASHTTEATPGMQSVLPKLRAEIESAIRGLAGIWVEDKGAALACHYRLADPDTAAAVKRHLEAIADRHRAAGAPILIQHGHQVSEIRPANVNKGKAVRGLLAGHAPHALPIYIGDDRTDMDAFQSLPDTAITIHVAPAEPTPARFRVERPGEVLDFLRSLLACRLSGAAP